MNHSPSAHVIHDCFVNDESVQDDEERKEKDILELIPMTLMFVKSIAGRKVKSSLLCLIDTGATDSWIKSSFVPEGVTLEKDRKVRNQTLAGPVTGASLIHAEQLKLPEFHRTRTIVNTTFRVFDSDLRYDAILGRKLLFQLGIVLDFKQRKMSWDDSHIMMRPYPEKFKSSKVLRTLQDDLQDEYLYDNDDATFTPEMFVAEKESLASEELGYKSSVIKESFYEGANFEEIARSCSHLTAKQQDELLTLLKKFPVLFDGGLGHYKDELIHLEIDPKAPTSTVRAYPVPHSKLKVFKRELDRLVEIDVFEEAERSEWIAGTFIVPKKDSRVRWITDFRALNKALRRKVYPIPKIQDIFLRRKRFRFLSKMDLSMQYYTFELDDESKEVCTFATPFGLYRYKRLPMGIKCAPDIAQNVMEKILKDINDIEIYIDDIAAFSSEWYEHLDLLEKVLTKLQEKGFKINPAKCEWGVQETDFLGHWLTPEGIKPWPKKTQAILNMKEPTNISELRSFLGLVTYYRDMWPRRSHVLAPLTNLVGKKKFVWGQEQRDAFAQMKALVIKDTMLAYPDHNLEFDVETDASDYQLGAVIKQNGIPVAFFSRKLNDAQKNYSTIEKELLSIVETFKEFRTML